MTEPDKPHEPKSAQERLDLGRSYYNEGKFDEAIAAWSNIHRDDDPETYARAQLGLGITYYTRGKLDDAIAAWSSIHHDDDPEAYERAQFSLGNACEDRGKLDDAITAWKKVREDNPETYAAAQFSLGLAYEARGKLDDAITAWKKIREDNPETYAAAQFNLGLAYYAQGKLDDAITAWKKIREDNPETYAKAQLNLGAAYYAQGKAQLNLGNTYKAQGKLDDAIIAWKKVREDNPETYAKAQLNLGVIYKDLAYKDKDEDQRKLDEAIAAWSNIHRDDSPETYAKAQLNLGEVYSLDKEKEEQSYEAYNNAQEFSYYKPERGFKILKCPQKIRKDLHTLAESTDEVLESLQIIPGFESQVAHYSRASTAFTLFGNKRNNQQSSHFRLSTIRGVNDPTEGLVLGKYWAQQGISETIYTNNTATFISCFTFNHDSLNQFRLYGKEDGQEATGVSLVFKKEFFRDQSDTLEFIAAPSIDPSSNSGQDSSKEKEKPQSNNKELIGKSTLYRCIYLDPETGYWTLAQRDKSTFYRQYKGEAKEKWEKYYESIPKKEEIVEKYLFAEDGEDNKNNSVLSILKSISKELEESNAPEESHTYSIEEKQKILEAIRFILLPLQYLVKHIAFQEEQECRIMYITQFRDEKIHSDREKQWMYVEYEEPVLPHIDKIWLSPGAAKDQDFFRILLDKGENDNKVRISQNPFRNKE